MDSNRQELQEHSALKFANNLLVLGGITNDRHKMFKFSEHTGTPRDV